MALSVIIIPNVAVPYYHVEGFSFGLSRTLLVQNAVMNYYDEESFCIFINNIMTRCTGVRWTRWGAERRRRRVAREDEISGTTRKAQRGENPIPTELNHHPRHADSRRYIDRSKEGSANKSADSARMNTHILRGAITVIAHYNILIWYSRSLWPQYVLVLLWLEYLGMRAVHHIFTGPRCKGQEGDDDHGRSMVSSCSR